MIYEYVLEDGGTIEDMLCTALRDIEANLTGRDCYPARVADSLRRATDALEVYEAQRTAA